MESALSSLTLKPTLHHTKNPFFNTHNNNVNLIKPSKQPTTFAISATTNPITQTLKLTARAIVLSVATATVISKFQQRPAIAEPVSQTPVTLESNSQAMDQTELAREALEQILTQTPLSFEALFEKAVLMDSFGEGEEVVKRLEKVVEQHNEKEARDVRLILAQVQFLLKNVDEALKRYDELVNEDPNDSIPYFCKGMIYSLIDRNDEAKAQFAKYRELSPKKVEV